MRRPDIPGHREEWEGFNLYSFEVDGRPCRAVAPEKEAPGRPWIWRARFFGVAPNVDIALLKRGFHLGYIDVSGLFGSPVAVAHWDAFYRKVTEDLGFRKEVALEGMSRGGLIVYNWAKRNPDKVACIYADAPVCDIKSWPGLDRPEHRDMRDKCLAVYGFTEQEARDFKDNPIDNLDGLAKHAVPLLHVSGDSDLSVPMGENSLVMKARYEALGGAFTLIVKKGGAHHPHGLENPEPIVSFILKNYDPGIPI